jgi:aminoglycoside/choline kinase family phosphotransferase
MEGFIFIVSLVLAIPIVIVYIIRDNAFEEAKRRRLEYEACLEALRNAPTNAQFHENALAAGRRYSNATRGKSGITFFDETAVANDIRAVTANASQNTPVMNPQIPTPSLDDRIAALQKLKSAGLINDEEFELKRKELIDSV